MTAWNPVAELEKHYQSSSASDHGVSENDVGVAFSRPCSCKVENGCGGEMIHGL